MIRSLLAGLILAASCGAPSLPAIRTQHPRLGLNSELIAQLRNLRTQHSPLWTRFEDWMDRERGGRGLYVYTGGEQSSALLGYVLTKNRAMFDVAMRVLAPSIWRDPLNPAAGLRPFFGKCPEADYCDDHAASSGGCERIYHVALLYDWAFDALTFSQRHDIVQWLNDAADFNHSRNPWRHAHFRNDGAYIMLATAATAYATANENPQAAEILSWFREDWKEALEALDVMGKGGAMAEGNAYGLITGMALVNIANMAWYAAGEDLFSAHPWFLKRLIYEAFTVYPNPPQDPPLDREGAALGGDDARGNSWHSNNLRPEGLALARRFAGTEEASIWNWVFRQRDIDHSADAWIDLMYYSPPPVLQEPTRLSYFDPSLGYVYVRSDWKMRDATWISFWAGPHLDVHQHLDQGAFTVFKRRDLAIKSGTYDYSTALAPHSLNYYTRTVSSNNILVGNPREYFAGFIAYYGCDFGQNHNLFPVPGESVQVCIANDGGQRTMYPSALSILDMNEWRNHKDVYSTARVALFQDTGDVVAWAADITNAYANPRYSAPGTQPKVTHVWRRFVYLRHADVLAVADDVAATDSRFPKSWLLHAVDRVEVGGTERVVARGESVHSGVNDALVVVDDREPSNVGQTSADLRHGYASLGVQVLLPRGVDLRVTGGREPGQHIRDFWVHDYSEGVLRDHQSANWTPGSPSELLRSDSVPTFGGGYGRWRIAVEPTRCLQVERFLTILTPSVKTKNESGSEAFETATDFGFVLKKDAAVWRVAFSKDRLEAIDSTGPSH